MKHLPLYIDTRAVVEKADVAEGRNKNCTRCKLSDGTRTVCMPADGVNTENGFKGAVLVLGDAPTRLEDNMGRPMSSGPNGHLRRFIEENIDGPIVYASALRCPPPDNKKATEAMINACRPYTRGLIDEVKPSRILCFGKHAYQMVLGSNPDPIQLGRRGYGYLSDGTPVFMFPAARRVTPNRFLWKRVKKDMQWALEAFPELPPWDGVINQVETVADSVKACAALADSGFFAYDTETGGLMGDDEYFQVVCLTATPGDYLDDAWLWGETALKDPAILEPLRDLLKDAGVGKVGHNLKFDLEAAAYGFDLLDDRGIIQIQNVKADTLLWVKTLDTESIGKLAICDHHVGMGGHKAENKKALDAARELIGRTRADPKQRRLTGMTHPALAAALRHPDVEVDAFAYALIPREILYRYCALDTIATARLHAHYEPVINAKAHFKRVSDELHIPPTSAIAQIEAWGMSADIGAARSFGKLLLPVKEELLAKIKSHGLTDDITPQNVSDFLFGKLGLPVQGVSEKTNKPSVDKWTLMKLENHHPIVPHLMEHAKVTKLLSTYVDGLIPHIRDDGRIRSSLNIAGARSGRMSCVAGWTEVKTQRGMVRIRDIVIGDKVWSHRGRWRRVTDVILKGIQPMVSVWLSNGKVLTCTKAHRVLSHDRRWVTVGSIVDEHFKEMGRGAGQPGEGSEVVQGYRAAPLNGEDGKGTRDHVSQCVARCSEPHARSGTESAFDPSLLSVEDWHQEPNDGEDGRCTPQLEGGVRGRIRIPDLSVQRQTPVRPPSGDGGSSGVGGTPAEAGRAPHRRRPKEQCARQFGVSDEGGAQEYSLFAGEGLEGVSVEEVYGCGDLQVYDISVEEDESYEACGVFSHNSSNPNLQNIPSRGVYAKMAKSIFNVPPGYVLLQLDYSQLEVRIAAMLSQDPDLIQAYIDGVDVHRRTAARAFGVDEKDVSKDMRGRAKAVVFGVMFGKTPVSLSKDLGISIQKAQEIYDLVLGVYGVLHRWMKDQIAYCEKTGVTWTYLPDENGILRRARVRQLWQVADPNSKSASRARNGSVNTPIQGSASDFMLRSIVSTVDWIVGDGIPARVTNTVHDSILLEVPYAWALEVAAAVKTIMESWPSAGVPLVADVDLGRSWGSLFKLEGIRLVASSRRAGLSDAEIIHLVQADQDLSEEMGNDPAGWLKKASALAVDVAA